MAHQEIDTFQIPSLPPSEDPMRRQLDDMRERAGEQRREKLDRAKDYLAYAATKPRPNLEKLDPAERYLQERFRDFDAIREQDAREIVDEHERAGSEVEGPTLH